MKTIGALCLCGHDLVDHDRRVGCLRCRDSLKVIAPLDYRHWFIRRPAAA
jgi:hypothetical protein